MKRILVLFLLLGLLLIAGCGGQPIQPTTEASQPLGTEDSTVTEPGTSVLTVDAVREQLQQQGKRFAVAHLGYLAYNENTQWPFWKNDDSIVKQLPLLQEIPETNVIWDAPQGEIFCLIPASEETTIKVYRWNSLSGNEPVYDTLVYEGTGPEPYILVCNAAFQPDTLVTIDFSDGKTWQWHPQLDDNLFVVGYWGGEFSDSEDGYDSLDISPYNAILLDYYKTMRDDPNSSWIVPTAEDMANTGWYNDTYDLDGNYHLWQMQLGEKTLDVRWNPGLREEDDVYEQANWSIQTKNNIAVLTIDFDEFAGIKSYNILLDEEDGSLYIAVDATADPISNELETLYRFLIPTGTSSEPETMIGSWVREFVYVDGDMQYDEAAVCTALIICQGDSYYITCKNDEMPARNLTDTPITILSGGGNYWLEDCQWVGRIEQASGDLIRYVAMTEDGGLMIQNEWTQDGSSSAGYEYFHRAD